MKPWVVAVLLIAVIVLGIGVVMMLRSGHPAQAATVQRGDIREFIDERGQTRLPRVYRITTPQAGWIEDVTLPEGTRVQQDQVVAQLSLRDLKNDVDEARAAVERLEAAIAENDDVSVESSLVIQARQFVESMSATVDASKARVDASAKRAEFAETNLGRVRQLHREDARTDDDLDRAQLAYWEGQLGYRQDLLVWGSLKSIQAATALLPKMVNDYIAHKELTRAVLEKQKAEAEAQLRRMLTRSERGVMRSPLQGTILKRFVQNQQYLPPGTELLHIGQLDDLQVEADILSQDVVRVQESDPVEVYGPAVAAGAGAGVAGSVKQIYPAGFTKVSSLGVEQQRVKVVVELAPDALAHLRQRGVGVGFRVRVRIFTEQKDDALIVPRSALFRSPAGHWQTFVVRGGRATLQAVEVGLMNDWNVEITDGVSEGEIVLLAPDGKLEEGTRIQPLLQ